MAEQYRVTSVGATPAEDRAHRMRVYFIAMGVRMLCVASLFFLRGWWILLAAAGAILLPYFAVMIANAVDHSNGEQPEQPTPLQLTEVERPEPGADEADSSPSETVIVVDAPAERRSQAHRATGEAEA